MEAPVFQLAEVLRSFREPWRACGKIPRCRQRRQGGHRVIKAVKIGIHRPYHRLTGLDIRSSARLAELRCGGLAGANEAGSLPGQSALAKASHRLASDPILKYPDSRTSSSIGCHACASGSTNNRIFTKLADISF